MSSLAAKLSEPAETFLEAKVRSGDFENRNAVLERAVSLMREDDAKLERLRAAIDEGLDELDAGLGIEVTDIRAWLAGLGR